jgi:vacuolar-type H+-ATPase subunit H
MIVSAREKVYYSGHQKRINVTKIIIDPGRSGRGGPDEAGGETARPPPLSAFEIAIYSALCYKSARSPLMQEIVEQVLKTEEEAEKILQEARRKAAELKTRGENEVSLKIKQARQEAQQKVQEAVLAAQQQAEESRRQTLEEAEAESRHLLAEGTDKLASLVEEVAAFVVKPEFRKD